MTLSGSDTCQRFTKKKWHSIIITVLHKFAVLFTVLLKVSWWSFCRKKAATLRKIAFRKFKEMGIWVKWKPVQENQIKEKNELTVRLKVWWPLDHLNLNSKNSHQKLRYTGKFWPEKLENVRAEKQGVGKQPILKPGDCSKTPWFRSAYVCAQDRVIARSANVFRVQKTAVHPHPNGWAQSSAISIDYGPHLSMKDISLVFVKGWHASVPKLTRFTQIEQNNGVHGHMLLHITIN